MKHNLKLAQRLGLSRYDLQTINFITGKSQTYGSVSIDYDIINRMLNYIDLMDICAEDNGIYEKIAKADREAFTKEFKDSSFHYVGLFINFDKNTVSIMYFIDNDPRFYYNTARKGRWHYE